MDDNGSGSYSAVSASKSWVSGVKYPDPETGQPELDPSIAFSYRLDGQVAQRTDGRGVMLAYDYDDEDRLGGIVADVPQGLGDGSLGDVDVTAIGMAYTYHPDGQLWHATTLAGGGGTLNDSVFTYGPFGLTATAAQNFNGITRNVGYQWDLDLYSATNTQSANRWRLIGMTYPDGLNANLTFGYGSANSLDDLLNRVAAITRGGQTVATWQYMGLSRELSEAFGSGASEVTRTYVSGGAVTGLDGHGRVTDIPWKDASANNLLRYQYDYDARGNRSFARITVPGLAAQDHSWLYRYDDLNRLVRASQGVLNPAGDGFEPTSSAQSHTWALDNLGNWSAGASDDSFRLFTEPAGAVDGIFNAGDTPLFRHHHAVTQQNEITTRWVGESGGDPVPENFAYDATGNLILDDDYYYVYDSFNRVAAIYERGTVTSDGGVLTGEPEDLGPCLAKYTYDALGRRVKTHRNPGQPGQAITRHVYGTGAAVLAEYSVNPSTNEETALRWFVHGEGFPEPLVMVDVSAAGDNPTPGVEEFLYYLTDVQGSVGALANAVGQVVERYFYTPYGQTQITAADGTTPRPESLYGNPFAYTGQRYEPQTGLYHFWARVYSPTLGRFLQEDAQGVLATASIALGYQGGSPSVMPPVTGPADEYPDLLNLYAYAMGNPLRFTDPLGLDGWDIYDEMVDDEIADVTGHKVATLGFLNEAAQIALVGMNASVSIAGSLLGLDLFQSFANIYEGKGSFGDYLEAGLTITGAGYGIYKAFKWGHKLAKASKARRILKANRARGLAFEEYGRRIIGIDKYRGEILAHNGRRFIPDGLTSTELIEFKDVLRISLSPQLKAMGHWAKANGRKAILYVSDRTEYISGPVRELFEVIPLP